MAADLTDRQREVLALMVEGDTNAEIARALCLSSDTVKFTSRGSAKRSGQGTGESVLRPQPMPLLARLT